MASPEILVNNSSAMKGSACAVLSLGNSKDFGNLLACIQCQSCNCKIRLYVYVCACVLYVCVGDTNDNNNI